MTLDFRQSLVAADGGRRGADSLVVGSDSGEGRLPKACFTSSAICIRMMIDTFQGLESSIFDNADVKMPAFFIILVNI